LPSVTQVLDEGLASNLPAGALYQPGTPRPSIVALFSSRLKMVQIVIPRSSYCLLGPYQEALARLQGERQPDLAVRWLNRLWIGRPMME